MQTKTKEHSPNWSLCRSWPLECFKIHRNFNREAENQPYIEWLQDSFDKGDQNSEDDEDEDNDASIEEYDTSDEVDGHGENVEKKDQTEAEVMGRNIVRRFMEGMQGDEDRLPSRDQVEVVSGFYEQGTPREESQRPVALLDDRKYGGTITVKRKHRRPYLGPLTAQQLREELSKKRFKIKSDQNDPSNRHQDEESDAERRVLFFTDLNSSTMETLAATAPYNHAIALKDLWYKYLKGKASIGVTIPPQGFKIFTFDLHIPYYVLKESKDPITDTRKRFDGRPLRQSWDLSSLSGPMSASPSIEGSHCLYEAQISISVTGIDHWVWTAYGIFDTYFGSKESVESYDQMKSPTGKPDPLSAGQLAANNPIWAPREYFFKVFEIRIHEVCSEWNGIFEKVDDEIKRHKQNHHIVSRVFNDSSTRQEVREISAWSAQMVTLLRRLRSKLSDTLDAWDKFQRKEIGYFLLDDTAPTASLPLEASVSAVDDIFEDLKSILKKLRELDNELCQENPQGLNAHYNHGNHEAQIFQQQSARHIQILTVITIAYLPLGLAAAMFSTQGVLPFTPNFSRFVYALFILGILVVVSIIALFKWHFLFQLIVQCFPWKIPKVDMQYLSSWILRGGQEGNTGDLEQG